MDDLKDEKAFNDEVEAEKRKISELFRELKSKGDSQNDDKLNWMYKNPCENVEREEYLLGRSVDKALDTLTGKSASTANDELANFPKRVVGLESSNDQIDNLKKIHEDPLFAMQQREIAARKQLLNNPLKVKELKMMLEVEAKKKLKIERKQRKEDRRRIKNERVNYLLIKQLRKISKHVDLKSLLNSLSDSDLDEKPPPKSSHKPKIRKHKEDSSSESTELDSDDERNNRISNDMRRDSVKNRKKPSSSLAVSTKTSKAKKSIKSKKKKYHSSSDSSSSSDRNRKKQSKKLKKLSSSSGRQKSKRKNKQSESESSESVSSSSSDSSSDARDHHVSIKNRGQKRHSSDQCLGRKKKMRRSDSESSEEKSPKRNKKIAGHQQTLSHNSHRNYKKSRKRDSSAESVKKQVSSSKFVNDKQKPFGLSMLDGSKPDKTEKHVPVYKKDESVKNVSSFKKHRPISDKEREDELKEMMENAKWRKKERESDYAKHKKNKQKEDKLDTYDDMFIKNQMSLLASSGSMADRVKSKMNTVQRSRSTMDTNFVRK